MCEKYFLVKNAVSNFEKEYKVTPNNIKLGAEIVHILRQTNRYTMPRKSIKITIRGQMEFNGISIETDYENPTSIVVGLIKKYS